MQNLRSRFLLTPKKTFLIKLVSVLGFGGMVGFCVLGCDKPAVPKNDVVKGSDPVEVGAAVEVMAPPDVPVDVVLEPSTGVLEPPAAGLGKGVEEEISEKYGPPPQFEEKLSPRYSSRMPKR